MKLWSGRKTQDATLFNPKFFLTKNLFNLRSPRNRKEKISINFLSWGIEEKQTWPLSECLVSEKRTWLNIEAYFCDDTMEQSTICRWREKIVAILDIRSFGVTRKAPAPLTTGWWMRFFRCLSNWYIIEEWKRTTYGWKISG